MNNPAARLHQTLTLCKKYEKESGSRPMLMGWRKVFRMGESVSDFSVLERIGRVYGIPAQIDELVGRFPDMDPLLYLGWREELEDAFLNVSFRSDFDTFTKRIPRTLLVNLEFCSNALSERCPEPMLDADRLAEIGKDAVEIIKSLPAADVDAPGKQYFHDYLTLISRAVADYMLSGAVGLQGAIDACTGTLVTQRGVSLANRETEVGKKFWALINKVTKALSAPEEEAEKGSQRKKHLRYKAMVSQEAA